MQIWQRQLLLKSDTGSTQLEDLLHNVSKYSPKLRNNGGDIDHEYFWRVSRAPAKLAVAIDQSFGSFDAFKHSLPMPAKTAGSGWAWLVLNADKN